MWIHNNERYRGKYTASNGTTDTFEIAHSFDGTGTAIYETGWIPFAGLTVAGENERASMTDNNEITFTNTEPEKAVALSGYTVASTSAVTDEFHFAVFKNDVRLDLSFETRDMADNFARGNGQVTTTVVDGDVLYLAGRNFSGTIPFVAKEFSLIVK